MGKLPAILFYPSDWLNDEVSGCSLAAQGLWLRMMIVMHSAERRGYLAINGRPMPDAFIASKCGTDIASYRSLLDELSTAGVPRRTLDEIIYNKRMVIDERERQSTKNRVAKHRSNGSCNASVTPPVTPFAEDEDVRSNSGSFRKVLHETKLNDNFDGSVWFEKACAAYVPGRWSGSQAEQTEFMDSCWEERKGQGLTDENAAAYLVERIGKHAEALKRREKALIPKLENFLRKREYRMEATEPTNGKPSKSDERNKAIRIAAGLESADARTH